MTAPPHTVGAVLLSLLTVVQRLLTFTNAIRNTIARE